MAITPRTIFTSPASATIATVSLLAFSAVGTLAYKVAQHDSPRSNRTIRYAAQTSCSGIREVLGGQKSGWSETAWMVYASCFAHKNDARMAAKVASRGLQFYPASERLYNIKGYHEISLGQSAKAVGTLETGLRNIDHPSNGVMENNLAWAGLRAPRDMQLGRGRTLYKRALNHNPDSCEMIHTGIWVEYGLARQSRGLRKYHALKNFLKLRSRYEGCQERADRGDWKSLVEVIGASVLFEDVDERLDVARVDARGSHRQLLEAAQILRKHYRGVSVDALCREAMPLATTHHMCTGRVSDALDTLQRQEANARRAGKHNAHSVVRSAGGTPGCVHAR